ncbi:MAG: GTP-binding protein [Planctomycetes bacterium]|nr:GTP-binding protein [Planctomycetota bacterium]
MNQSDDTYIVQITPPGEGGIAVIALAGKGAEEMLNRFFEPVQSTGNSKRNRNLFYGHIKRDNKVLDEVIVARVGNPFANASSRAYEINCHGGAAAVSAVMDCFQHAGAQSVPWQEFPGLKPDGAILSHFTLRARALSSLPQAETRLAARMLLHQANGALSNALQTLLLCRKEREFGKRLDSLLATSDLGQALLDSTSVLLAGPPNVGKSTLLNTLLSRERVIVHHRPGTTRDLVRETISLKGVPFELIDSAGIRPGAQDVEAEAINKTLAHIRDCNILVFVYDAREKLEEEIKTVSKKPLPSRVFFVGNKIDLLDSASFPPRKPPEPFAECPHIFLSAKTGENVEHLENALLKPYICRLPGCRGGEAFVFDKNTEKLLCRVRQLCDDAGFRTAQTKLGEAGVVLS